MAKVISLKVNDSIFFEKIDVKFSEALNCIMGGRGTGKTTLLWMISAALGEDVENDKNVYNLLKANLGSGVIDLEIEGNNKEIFKLSKVLGEKTSCTEVSTGKSVPVEKIRQSLKIDFYKSSSIEGIGLDGYSRLNLIDQVLGGEIIEFKKKLEIEAIGLSESERNIEILLLELKKIEEQINENQDIEKQLNDQKKTLPKDADESINESFKVENDKQQKRLLEKDFINETLKKVESFKSNLQNLNRTAKDVGAYIGSFSDASNSKELKEFKERLLEVFAESVKELEKITVNVDLKLKESIKIKDVLSGVHERQELEFVALKQRMKTHREYFQQLNYLTKKKTELDLATKKKKEIELKIHEQLQARDKLINQLSQMGDQLFEKRLNKVKDINQKLGSDIRVTLERGGIKEPFEEKLKEVLSNLGFRYSKQLAGIVNAFSPTGFSRAIQNGKFDEIAKASEVEKARIVTICEAIKARNLHFEFDALYCPDLPKFFLKVDRKDDEGNVTKENFRDTEELSTGQRCTAILPIIFAASSNPLIIDQPEDNLDNRYITHSIHDLLRKNKSQRQLIFVTHNPNIPVISESEYNLFLDYKDRQSHKLSEGTIENVKSEILNLLEGGEEAFNARKQIYGY